MSVFVGFECLAANALIELAEKKNNGEISFETLVSYAREAARVFEENTGEQVILRMSSEDQQYALEAFPEFFEADAAGNYSGFCVKTVRLKVPLTHRDLEPVKSRFRWTLRFSMYEALTSPKALRTLGVA